VARAYRLGADELVGLMVTAARAAFLPDDARAALETQIRSTPLPAT